MSFFTKESLETLRQRVNLVEVISSYVELKRSGAVYKGLCPFHDEKTPSFVIQNGQSHYHCFGCGAHGDAIGFLMQCSKLTFFDAVESLAQRYQVALQKVEVQEEGKSGRKALKATLEQVSRFYQACLLHTEFGREAFRYLEIRGIDLEFIHRFRLGCAPFERGLLLKAMAKLGVDRDLLIEAGVLIPTSQGGFRELFAERITFPICDGTGGIIGFSARKFREETYGGKYVNTPETPLFKKSRVLFGLDHSRRRIAKERRAIVVEGQLDALRLISQGLDLVIAGQGTAFGEGHLKELALLGVDELFIAFDADQAGREAAVKVGDLFQKKGIGVKVLRLPEGADPDGFVRQRGIEAFVQLLEKAQDYLPFLVEQCSAQLDLDQPAGKHMLVQRLSRQIRDWEEPIMVHEGLRYLARLLQLPEEIVGVNVDMTPRSPFVRQGGSYAGPTTIDPDRIIEGELIRWFLVAGDQQVRFAAIASHNLLPEMFRIPICRRAYEVSLNLIAEEKRLDLLTLAIALEDSEGQSLIHEIMQRKVQTERALELFTATLQKICDREWMRQREALRVQIQSGHCSDDEVQALLQQFDALKSHPPKVSLS